MMEVVGGVAPCRSRVWRANKRYNQQTRGKIRSRRILSASSALVSVIGSTGRLRARTGRRKLSAVMLARRPTVEALAAVGSRAASRACGRAGGRLAVDDLAIWRIASGGLATVRGSRPTLWPAAAQT